MSTMLQQQTDGGLIDISAIFDLVNAKRLRQGKSEARVNHYFENGNSQEYLQTLLSKMGLKELTGIPASVQGVEIIEEQEKITINQLKELHLYKDTRGKYAGTWFTPLLAIDIVGWLDPEIRLHFNAIVYEKLFESRIIISSGIRELTDKITSVFGSQSEDYFTRLNVALNVKIFGRSEKDIRNTSTKEQYDKLEKLMKTLVIFLEQNIFDFADEVINKISRINI